MLEVLVIDDQIAVLSLLQMFLVHLGYMVKLAHDGKEGIDRFDSERGLDLVITDIRMPGMDGNAVARHIRNSDRPDMPIIAVSGFAEEIESKLFNYFLPKPFDIETLADAIKSIEGDQKAS